MQAVSGFCGAQLLPRDEGTEVAFTSIAWFTDMDAVRGFVGDNCEQVLVEDAARAALSRWDKRVTHHDATVHVQMQPDIEARRTPWSDRWSR